MKRNTAAPLILGGLAAAALAYVYLRNKARAGQNLRFEPVDIAIDTARTRAAIFTRLFYTIKIRLVNDEPAAVVVKSVNLAATANGRPFGNLTSAERFTVPAKGSQVIALNTSIATLGAAGAILDYIRNRQPVGVTINGYVDTDLGRVTVEYNTSLGGGIFGFVAEYENPATGGRMIRYFNNRTEAAANVAAQKAKTKNQILVSVTKQKTYKQSRRITDEAKQKTIQSLQNYFGGKKYNVISDKIILRIADHSKNPYNDGKYNYDKRVISFVLPSYGGKFSGYNANEYDLSGLTYAESVRFIKSKIYK